MAVSIPVHKIANEARIPRDIPRDAPRDAPWDIPWDIPWQIPWDIPWHVPWDIPWDIQWDIPWHIPCDIPWDVPWHIPWDIPWDVPRVIRNGFELREGDLKLREPHLLHAWPIWEKGPGNPPYLWGTNRMVKYSRQAV